MINKIDISCAIQTISSCRKILTGERREEKKSKWDTKCDVHSKIWQYVSKKEYEKFLQPKQ